MSSLSRRVAVTAEHVGRRAAQRPKVAFILGSGLGAIGEAVDRPVALDYDDVPHFPTASVPGHRGRLVMGTMRGVPAIVFDGRLHLYEGVPAWQVAYPVYVAHRLGATMLVVTNAAGGINASFSRGTIMLIRDHINMTGASPLTGLNEPELGSRFPNMRGAYDEGLRQTVRAVAQAHGIPIAEGVYAAMPGPSYETDAELRMLGVVGADAVGMSTVHEVIAARHAGMRVAGISVISNDAHPMSTDDLSHDAVRAAVAGVAGDVRAILEGLVERAFA